MHIRHYALAVVLLLTGCGKDESPVVPAEQPQGSVVLIETPALLEPAPQAQVPVAPAVASTTAKAKPAPPSKSSAPVDLSLPKELLDGLHLGQPMPGEQTQALLPPLFVDKPASERSLQFNGRLLLDKDPKDDYRTSVEGAELQLEFKR